MYQNQILYDPTGRRRRIVNIIAIVSITAFFISAAILTLSLLTPPEFSAIDTPDVGNSILTSDPNANSKLFTKPAFSALNNRDFHAAAVSAKRFAFLEMDDVGQLSAKENAAAIDGLLPDFLALNRLGELSQRSPNTEDRLRRSLRQNSPHLQIYPILSNGTRSNDLASYLSSDFQSKKVISEISTYLEKNGDAGIALNFEELLPASQPALFRFLKDLSAGLKASNRGVIVIFPATADRSAIQVFAQAADYVLVLLFKEGGRNAEPLASQEWFESQLAILTRIVDRSKLIIGIGSFGYDYGRPTGSNKISVSTAWSLLRKSGSKLLFDTSSLNPWFRYTDLAGILHTVWLLDGVTAFNQVKAALSYRTAGLALSEIGFEDPSVWAVFERSKSPDSDALKRLESPPNAFHTEPASRRPETLIATPAGDLNVRSLSYNKGLGLIVNESLDRISTGKEIIALPYSNERLLAITFDDGPDSRITNKLLDILAAKNVKATFFVVGKNALPHNDILARTYREGHDIGNHTYSHPRVSELSSSDLDFELTSTQRVLEATLGIHTKLFRPTFGGGLEDPENLGVIEKVSRLNYITVLSGIDSFDWVLPSPPAGKMVDAVLKQVASGKGQVLLFHDWGEKGNLQALPILIDNLRAKGFEFVAIHELLGKTREDVMPAVSPVTPVDKAIGGIRQSSLLAIANIPNLILSLGLVLGAISIFRYSFVIFAARRQMRSERKQIDSSYWPSVAVIVPAYNEEKVICKTITSVLGSSHSDFEIIVVDDGSKDATAKVVRQTFADNPRVKVFVKPNGGKATAGNFGLKQTNAEVVVCIDADTVLSEDAIPLLVRHFSDPTVGAVAGTAVVGNELNFLTKFQAIEYTIGQYLDRRAFGYFNAIGVVPGAIGAWRREALLLVGGYSSDTLAEDADATIAIVNAGWRVVSELGAQARTEAPEKVKAFLKQRYRWMFGTLQVMVKHARSSFEKKNTIFFITMPNSILSLLGFALFIPILDVASIFSVCLSAYKYFDATEMYISHSHLETMSWWIFFQVLSLIAITGSLIAVRAPCNLRLFILLLLQRFLYAPLLYWVAAAITLKALKGQAMGWGKLARTGSVTLSKSRRICQRIE